MLDSFCQDFLGTAQAHSSSILRLFLPRAILKKPFSPQYVPQELRPTQYLVPSSAVPQPSRETTWRILRSPVVSSKTPPLYSFMKESVTATPQATGPRDLISAMMFCSPRTWPYSEMAYLEGFFTALQPPSCWQSLQTRSAVQWCSCLVSPQASLYSVV